MGKLGRREFHELAKKSPGCFVARFPCLLLHQTTASHERLYGLRGCAVGIHIEQLQEDLQLLTPHATPNVFAMCV